MSSISFVTLCLKGQITKKSSGCSRVLAFGAERNQCNPLSVEGLYPWRRHMHLNPIIEKNYIFDIFNESTSSWDEYVDSALKNSYVNACYVFPQNAVHGYFTISVTFSLKTSSEKCGSLSSREKPPREQVTYHLQKTLLA